MRHRISEIARFTKQPQVAAEFYARVLDVPVPEAEWDAFTFEVGGVSLFVHPAGDEPTEPGWPANVDHVAFEVEDLDAECARLSAAGYDVIGPSVFPWGRSAYLYDPDGRMVELHGSNADTD